MSQNALSAAALLFASNHWKDVRRGYTLPKNSHSQFIDFRIYHKGLKPQENLKGLSKLMRRMSMIFIILVLVAIAGGIGVLAKWDIPAPVSPVEKVLPDERFPR